MDKINVYVSLFINGYGHCINTEYWWNAYDIAFMVKKK